MPAGILRPCLAGARLCAACVLTLLLWTLWLALALVLIFQAYIASVNEMPVPRFLLNGIESHLAATGVTVKFGRATFDPTGRVLLEKAQFTLESFAEPVVTADAIYLKLDPWALLARRFEAREIRATGANLFVPAMLSASGRPEKIVEDLDASFSLASRGDEFTVDYLNCRLGEICVSAHGQVNAGPVARSGIQATHLPLAEFLSGNYVGLSREFLRVEEQLAGVDHAVVTAVLTPSDTRGAIVNAEIFAAGVKMTAPVGVEATRIRGASRFPLLGGAAIMTSAVATAESLTVGGVLQATGARARLRGLLKIDTLAFDPRAAELTAGFRLVGATRPSWRRLSGSARRRPTHKVECRGGGPRARPHRSGLGGASTSRPSRPTSPSTPRSRRGSSTSSPRGPASICASLPTSPFPWAPSGTCGFPRAGSSRT